MRSGPRWPRCEACPAATTTTPASWRPQMVSFLLAHTFTHRHTESHLPSPFSPAVCPSVFPLVSRPVWLARATDWPCHMVTEHFSSPTEKSAPFLPDFRLYRMIFLPPSHHVVENICNRWTASKHNSSFKHCLVLYASNHQCELIPCEVKRGR